MGYLMLLLLAIALSMDAFAMSAQKSLLKEFRGRQIATACAFWFGMCQASMVLCGRLIGSLFDTIWHYQSYVWVPCAALGIAGVYMIIESLWTRIPPERDSIDGMNMVGPAVATSLDALLVGLLLVAEDWKLTILSLLIIAFVTALVSIFGVWVGRRKGTRYNEIVQIFGGLILILLGVEKLLENLGVIKFVL